MTKTHEIKLDGYGAHTTLAEDRPIMLLGTAESYGIETLHVVSGKSWEGLTVTATFNAPDGTSTDMLIDADGSITVPPEATDKSGSGRIVFTGVSNGIQRISCDLEYFVVAHSAINGVQSGGTAPSWFEQAATRFMPAGGTAGQVLTKLTNTDFDAEWQDSKGGADGKSAYSYAVDGGYTGTEAEFAAKLAAEKLPNPYPLTFTGAVNETYDGSSAKTIEIPSGGGTSGSGGEGATSNYIELGTLPYTVGNITELYLEPSADCSLVIGSGNDNNLITSLEDGLISSQNPVIDNLVSEEYYGTHTVKLTATNTNAGNNFYDIFSVSGLTVGKEYTFSATVDLTGISGSAYGLVELKSGSNSSYGSVDARTNGERVHYSFTANDEIIRIRLCIWTGSNVVVGDAITYSDCLLCEGTSTEFGTSVTYELSAGNKTKLSFAEGTEIPAVDGVTITVYKLVEGVAGDLFVFLGDSIPCFDSNTGGIGAIPDYLREKCGGTWKNFCVGGTTMSAYRTTGNGYEYFTLDEWADSIATGDFANQEQGVTDGASAGSTSYSLTKKVSDAQTLDWGAVKRIFFAFGTNDLAYGVSEVGASTDAAAKHGTMCAALKYAVQTIHATYPTIEIVVCGIIYRHADNPSMSAIIAANDAIRATCESIGVPFVPLFENMGVNEWNRTAFLYDGTHPNAAGKERYANTVKRLLCL